MKTLLLLSAIVFGACQSERAAAPIAAPANVEAPAASAGKPGAPVVITVALDAARPKSLAHVSVRFTQPGSAIAIQSSGVRGVTVDAPALQRDAVAADELVTLDVPFVAGEPMGESLFVVAVSGRFASGERRTVRAFVVDRGAKQAKAPTTTSDGERLEIVPAR